MMYPAPFQRFVDDFGRLVDAASGDEGEIMKTGGELLGRLVASDDWLPPAFTVPHPEYYLQYLLHCDPQERFSVVSFVWGPGQKTPVHDHTVWGLIGMLRGSEHSERFRQSRPGGPMEMFEKDTLQPGQVDRVSPAVGDIHRVSNAYDDRVSISIHVYGADIGKVKRHVFDIATGSAKEFVSGYANAGKTEAGRSS